ncbi:ATP-binding protein, partial [Cutibacterium acnes]
EKGIAVTLSCDAEPPPIEIDSRRMAQVFLNLLGNAIRYTPAGGSVTVHVSESAPVSGERRMLQVSFADTGPGIAPEHLPYLFERFYRTDEARSRESGGMGLGLAIAKQFVLNHNGSIEARSQVGLGTTIIVRLPL